MEDGGNKGVALEIKNLFLTSENNFNCKKLLRKSTISTNRAYG